MKIRIQYENFAKDLTRLSLSDLLTGYEGEFVTEDSLLTALQVAQNSNVTNVACETGSNVNAVEQRTKYSSSFNKCQF